MLCAGIDVSKPHLDLALVSTTAKPTRLQIGRASCRERG